MPRRYYRDYYREDYYDKMERDYYQREMNRRAEIVDVLKPLGVNLVSGLAAFGVSRLLVNLIGSPFAAFFAGSSFGLLCVNILALGALAVGTVALYRKFKPAVSVFADRVERIIKPDDFNY